MRMPSKRVRFSLARHHERGAISIMAAAGLTATLIAAALAVDIGRLAFAERRLQLVADMAAMDAARCTGGGLANDANNVQSFAQASALRNNFLLSDPVNTLPVALGKVSTDAGHLRQFAAAGLATPNAVQVTANRTIPLSFIAGGLFPATTGTAALTEVAVARGEPQVGIRAGSFLLNVNTQQATLLNNVLGGMLGATLNLSAVSYQGLIDSSVTLGDLIAASGSIGTVDELLSTNMSVREFLQLAATALQNQGNPTAAATLNNLAVLVNASLDLTVGDLIQVTTENPEAAADAAVNVFDLLMLGAQVARGDAAVTVPAGISIPGVATATLTVKVIEPPQIVIGPPGFDAAGNPRTEVRTAQVRSQLDIRALGLVAGGVVNLNVAAQVAQTRAFVQSFNCATGEVTVNVTPGAASLHVGRFSPSINDPHPTIIPSRVLNLTLLGIPVLRVDAAANVPLASNPEELVFAGPFPAEPQTAGTALGGALDNALASLASSLVLTPTVLGILPLPLNTILGQLLGILSPIVRGLDVVLEPLFQALGATVGGADVSVTSVTTERQLVR